MMKTRELLLAMVDLWTITLVDPSELVMFIRDVPEVGAADLGTGYYINIIMTTSRYGQCWAVGTFTGIGALGSF